MGMMYCRGKFEKLKDTFLISGYKNEDFYEQLGSVPVVRLNIGQPKLLKSLKNVCDTVKRAIQEAIDEHRYILHVSSANVDSEVKDYQDMFKSLEVSLNSDTGNGNMMCGVIPRLINLLYKIFQRKILVIIDEYDAILNKVYFGDSTLHKTEMADVAEFFAGLYGQIIKQNINVERVFVTGIQCWRGCSIFSSMSRMEFNTLDGGNAINFYGMSDDNVMKLLANAGLSMKFGEVVNLYDGYNFGRSPKHIHKYNPYAIACFISRNGIRDEKNFWSQTSSTSTMLRQLIKYKNFNEKFLLLISDRAIKVNVYNDATFTFEELEYFSNAMLVAKESSHEYEWGSMESPKNADDFGFRILLATGYLTETSGHPTDYEEFRFGNYTHKWVRATNQEVLDALSIDYVSTFTGTSVGNTPSISAQWTSSLKNCFNALKQVLQGPDPDFKKFANSFQRLIYSFSDITRHVESNGKKAYANEDIFKKLLTIVIGNDIHDLDIRRLETQHQFKYNATRSGRPDVVCQKHNDELFIFELKYCRGDELDMEKIKNMLNNGTTQALGYAEWYLNGTDHRKYNAPNATVVVLLVTEYEKQVLLQTSYKSKYWHTDFNKRTTVNYWPDSFHHLT